MYEQLGSPSNTTLRILSVKGGGTPQIRNSFFAGKKIRKGGGGTPLTDKIRKVVFEVFPKYIVQNFNSGKI